MGLTVGKPFPSVRKLALGQCAFGGTWMVLARNILIGVAAASLSLCAGQALAAPAPTFEQVLAAPDDAALNLDYATAQANAGSLLDAASALERVLAVHPEWDSARLLYAAVLYRLGDFQGSSAQMDQVHDVGLTPQQQGEARKYRGQARQAASHFSYRGNLAVGAVYQSDAAGSLAIQQTSLIAAVPKNSGWASVVGGSIEGEYRLSERAPVSLYGSASGLSLERLSGPSQQLSVVEGQAGLGWVSALDSLRLGGVVRDDRLFRQHYLTEAGVHLEAARRFGGLDTVSATFEAVHQAYDNQDLIDLATGIKGSSDGWRYDASVKLEHRFGASASVTVGAGLERKDARYGPFAYDGARIEGGYYALLGRGAYLNLTGAVRSVRYDKVDTLFLGVKRRDTISQARLAVGAPLSALFPGGATGDIREALTLEGAVSYLNRDTKAPLANYDSTGAEIRLIWRFGAS